MIFSILTGIGALLVLASITTAIQVLRAPEGYEDADGFHVGKLAPVTHYRHLKPAVAGSAQPRRLHGSRATVA